MTCGSEILSPGSTCPTCNEALAASNTKQSRTVPPKISTPAAIIVVLAIALVGPVLFRGLFPSTVSEVNFDDHPKTVDAVYASELPTSPPTTASSNTTASGSSPNANGYDGADSQPKVLNWKLTTGDFGTKFITGQIHNQAETKYRFVSIEFNLYDRKGVRVGSATDMITNLEPNTKWNFKALVLDKNVTSAKLEEVNAH